MRHVAQYSQPAATMGNAFAYVELLGMKTASLPALLREVEKGLPYRAYERFADSLGAPADEVLKVIGIPRRTLIRRKSEGRFSSEESDRLLRAARVFASALDLFGGDGAAALEWLSEPQIALGGSIPLHVARTEVGAHEVELLALRIEHGVYS